MCNVVAATTVDVREEGILNTSFIQHPKNIKPLNLLL